MRRDSGGAKVDGEAKEAALIKPGPEVDQLRCGACVVVVDRKGHLPFALAQDRLQSGQDVVRHRQVGNIPLGG